MMFSCCHPRLPEESQVALILNILCGFGAAEIAGAFLAGGAAIEKRISRGKKVLARARRLFDLADAEFIARLSAVRRALYLLFNEGYHGASAESAVRAELCSEAIRLMALLGEYPPAASPEPHALAALMSLHAAPLPARSSTAPHEASRSSPRARIANGSTNIRSIRRPWASWSSVEGIGRRRGSISRQRSRSRETPPSGGFSRNACARP